MRPLPSANTTLYFLMGSSGSFASSSFNRDTPFHPLYLPTDRVHDVRQARVGDRIASRVHDAVDDRWFSKDNFRRQRCLSSDVVTVTAVSQLPARARYFAPGRLRRTKAQNKLVNMPVETMTHSVRSCRAWEVARPCSSNGPLRCLPMTS